MDIEFISEKEADETTSGDVVWTAADRGTVDSATIIQQQVRI